MSAPPPRVVTLVLCLEDGAVLGALPPFDVEVPWWQEAGPVVDRARELHGLDVTVLRLLDADARLTAGGPVTYLAQVPAPVAGLRPWGELADHPLRLPWARPGGPAADLAWADEALDRLGRVRTAPARQVRSWNLSSVWRLPLADGAAWLKVLPPFLADEGRVLAHLDTAVAPPLLAHDRRRVLLDEVPGEDLYEAAGPLLDRMVSLLVGLQVPWSDRVPELLDLGVGDWRLEHLGARAAQALARTADQLDADVVRACDALIAGLERRAGHLASCGVPDTLVHGDFHPGNLRGDVHPGDLRGDVHPGDLRGDVHPGDLRGDVHPGDLHGDDRRLVLLDWGDCGVGHPLLDRAAFLGRVPVDERPRLRQRWDDLWRSAVPGCDPGRAAELLGPVAGLRDAVVYDAFLGAIEPGERVYHAADPARCLREVAGLVRDPQAMT